MNVYILTDLNTPLSEIPPLLSSGAVSTPFIEVVSDKKGHVVLQCNSTGWYPEPEVFWLDGEGNLLSAGPTETVRGPDDLYTVSSRVTVEKRHSNSFTCRVQQNHINQTRETHIHVPGRKWFLHIFNIYQCFKQLRFNFSFCSVSCCFSWFHHSSVLFSLALDRFNCQHSLHHRHYHTDHEM